MEKKGTVVIGNMPCPVCGKMAPVKKSLRGRLSLVCKWQDDGCGAQLQTLTVDASIMMMQRVREIEQAQVEDDMPKGEQMKKEEEKPAKAPSVNESEWGLL